MKRKGSYDYYLILATALVLFIISVVCIYGMFYFKIAQIHQMAPTVKVAYMDRMNTVIAPFLICLILLLGICVPKRLLPTAWLNRVTAILIVLVVAVSLVMGIKNGVLFILAAALILQTVVLGLALSGSKNLHFEKKGYWVRVGSSLIHLGLILFVFDLFFYKQQVLHLLLFWITTGATVIGMLFCFYAETVVRLIGSKSSSDRDVTT
jgi:hypothetical protein